jgi:hypothetical protein
MMSSLLLSGAVQVIVSRLSANKVVGSPGASGYDAALTDIKGEGSPSPASLFATTMNEYVSPAVKEVASKSV